MWELASGFVSDPNHQEYNAKTVRYITAISTAMKQAMTNAGYKVDYAYKGLLVKNPWYDGWTTITCDRAYSFQELHAHLDLPWGQTSRKTIKDQDENPEGRNCTLFDRLRFWAYRNVRFHPNQLVFDEALHQQAHILCADFDRADFSDKEIDRIADLVGGYVWDRYECGHYHTNDIYARKTVMNLSPDMPISDRLMAGQQYTCDQRNAETRDQMAQAILRLQQDGLVVTKAAVARICKRSRPTLDKHWSVVQSMVTPSVVNVGDNVVPLIHTVTVETENPSGPSHLSGSFAAGYGADTMEGQLYTLPPANQEPGPQAVGYGADTMGGQLHTPPPAEFDTATIWLHHHRSDATHLSCGTRRSMQPEILSNGNRLNPSIRLH